MSFSQSFGLIYKDVQQGALNFMALRAASFPSWVRIGFCILKK